MGERLTEAQVRVLRVLAGAPYLSPAEIGWSLSPKLKAQGAGRLGGTMGWRLVAKGMAAHHHVGRWSRGYHITPAGRAALAEMEKADD